MARQGLGTRQEAENELSERCTVHEPLGRTTRRRSLRSSRLLPRRLQITDSIQLQANYVGIVHPCMSHKPVRSMTIVLPK